MAVLMVRFCMRSAGTIPLFVMMVMLFLVGGPVSCNVDDSCATFLGLAAVVMYLLCVGTLLIRVVLVTVAIIAAAVPLTLMATALASLALVPTLLGVHDHVRLAFIKVIVLVERVAQVLA